MKLVDEWRQAWKWFNIHLGIAISIAPEIYQQFDGLRGFVPQAWFNHGMAVLGVLVIVNTLKKKTQSDAT